RGPAHRSAGHAPVPHARHGRISAPDLPRRAAREVGPEAGSPLLDLRLRPRDDRPCAPRAPVATAPPSDAPSGRRHRARSDLARALAIPARPRTTAPRPPLAVASGARAG